MPGMARPHKDLTGQTFNKLTAIKHLRNEARPTDTTRGNAVWLWQCQCGVQIECMMRHVTRGFKKSCGCHVRRGSQSVAYHVYSKYIADGSNLTFTDFCRLSQLPCHYCGTNKLCNMATKNGSLYQYNGLDRLDNGRGHDLDNVVPCCWTCNEKKSDMNYDQFISWIETVFEHTSRTRAGSPSLVSA